MAQVDFKKLLESYSEPDKEGRPRRTPEAQRVWLANKQVPPEIISSAMAVVYARLADGKTFESGRELDHYLLKEARKQQLAQSRALLRTEQANLRKLTTRSMSSRWWEMLPWAFVWFIFGMAAGQWL